MELFDEEKAQVSAELLVVIAAVLAVALILVNNLKTTAEKGNETINKKTESIMDKIEEMGM
ncbi:MAG: class III signal peptide-containing protein [Candidatus Diapherotrites archaeon]|nr:class III signal peptide-containing protein [Candidatus Diapherotrites archaeon]